MPKSVRDILLMKNSKKITVITAYDYTIAHLCDKAGVDILLVGDSAGMVMLGYENTIPVTMEQMCLFTEAVLLHPLFLVQVLWAPWSPP